MDERTRILQNLKYPTHMQRVEVGDTVLVFEAIRSLDEAIDLLCEQFTDQIDPELEHICPYYGLLWPSAYGLTEYIKDHLGDFKNKTILELGCGLALPSFYLKKKGMNVTSTDFHPDVENFLQKNFKHNSISFPHFSVNWQENAWTEKYDLVIGSDVLYEGSHPKAIATALKNLIKDDGKILLADPGRGYLQTFLDEAQRQGLSYELFPYKVLNKDEIFVFELKKL